MTDVLLLGRRATREIVRYPEATIPTLFIPLFFLVVNIGQVSKTFPSSTPFLKGQGYVAFQLPVSLMFAVATATSGLALVTEIDLGYFDKLLVAPIRRSSIIFGRLTADLVRGIATSALVLVVGIALGARIEAGIAGAVVIVLLSALFGVAYAGFGLLVALRTRNVQATQSSFLLFFPLLFLTPNFVPFDRLSPLMETLARINPVSYVIVGLRSLVIDGWELEKIVVALLVIVAMGLVLTGLSLRVIATTTADTARACSHEEGLRDWLRRAAWPRDSLRARSVAGPGFEPGKAEPTRLQRVPFDRSGIPPSPLSLNVDD